MVEGQEKLGADLKLLLSDVETLLRATVGGAALLTVFFYVPILAMEIRSQLAVEGINGVADTLLFAATALLAGFDAYRPRYAPPSSVSSASSES